METAKRIGLDKMKFSNLKVKDIDVGKLKSMKNVELVYSAERCIRYVPHTNIGIRKIVIKDNQIFSDLTIGCTSISCGSLIEYTYLTVTVSNAKGYNLENMSYTEYSSYLENVISYINNDYGIDLDISQMKIDYIEINSNIFLQEKYANYNRTLRLFIVLFKYLGKLSSYEVKKGNSVEKETHMRGNKSRTVIFYNKANELRAEGMFIDKEILRIEIRLKTARVIQDAFGSRYWKDLNEKKIIEYYYNYIYKNLSKEFEKWQKKKQGELMRLIKKCQKTSKRNWHYLLMESVRNRSEYQTVPYILDIEQVFEAFRKLPDPNRNASRALKPFARDEITDDVYKGHGIQKAHEILDTVKRYAEEGLHSINHDIK